MNIFALFAIINVVVSIVFGTLVLFSNPRHRINQLFFLLTLSITAWSFSYFIWQLASSASSALFWVHGLMAGAIFIPFIYFHFIARFLNLQHRLRVWIWIGYAIALFLSVVNWTPLFVASVGMQAGFSFWPSAGVLFSPFLIVWIFYAAATISLLVRRMKFAAKAERAQIQYILIGTIIGYAGGCTNYFLWYGVSILPYGNITTAIYIFLVAYAVMKRGLFDMKIVAAELLVFMLWLFVFIRMLIATTAQEQLINGILLITLLAAGTLLIRSVDREIAQRELIEQQARELQETNARQETLIHFVSHEVKGFLTKDIDMMAMLIEGDFGALPARAKPFVDSALVQAREGARSVISILKAANLKKGNISYAMSPFDFAPIVKKVFANFQNITTHKKLAFTLSVDRAGEPYIFTGDAEQLGEHVFRNLIENAINYTPKGSVSVSLTKNKDGQIIFTVQDTGVGITSEDKKHLFTEGGHGKNSIKVNAHSTGYGLYIAKSVVVAHHGTIRAESDGAGSGSKFIVEFPAG